MAEFWIPKDLVEEEERLHKEREEEAASEAAADPPTGPILDNKKFQALEQLLNQSEMYTQFLAEQMLNIEQQTEADAKRAAEGRQAETSDATAGGRKRGKAQDTKGAKKAKSSLTPTQVGAWIALASSIFAHVARGLVLLRPGL